MTCEPESMSSPSRTDHTSSGVVWRFAASSGLSVFDEAGGGRRLVATDGDATLFDRRLSPADARHLAFLLAGEQPHARRGDVPPLARAWGVTRSLTREPVLAFEIGGRILRLALGEADVRFFAEVLEDLLAGHFARRSVHSDSVSGSPNVDVSSPEAGENVAPRTRSSSAERAVG